MTHDVPEGWEPKEWAEYLRLIARYTAWLKHYGANPMGHDELMRWADRIDPQTQTNKAKRY